ncbi:MAG: gamma-glutamyltransferase family protein [Phycisphaerae bacterium]
MKEPAQAQGPDRITGRPFATRSEVIAQHGMAATSQPLATQVALEILRRGGTAVDAAIAANAALGLMEPTGSGLGGDLFAIVWSAKDSKLYGLNASGRSPYGLSYDEMVRRVRGSGGQSADGPALIPLVGPLPVSVPGCVDGWFELHDKFGKLPMRDVLAPAIRYAREGFPVSELIAYYWGRGGTRLRDQPNFAETFLPNERAPHKGEIFRNPDLARTLERIAAGRRDVFYKGPIAETIDAFCRRVGCYLRARDLAEHHSTWVEPVSTNYRGYDVWELPPNGQGIAVLQILNLIEPFDLRSMGHNTATYLHHLIEAKKLAYEDRARFYTDPDFHEIPVQTLVSKSYANQRRALFDAERASRRLEAGNPRLERGDTIYLTVADADRNMVSLIQSNYAGLGSGLVPDGLGFVLQDRGALFTLEAGQFNTYAPHKRPFHTIIPAFVTKDGRPFLSFGVMGGDMQPQGHVQVLCNLIDFGMNVQEAGDAARFRHIGSSTPTGRTMTDGGTVLLESGVAMAARRGLRRLGHRIGFESGGFGGYQAILYDAENDVYIGASESRKDGQAAGY